MEDSPLADRLQVFIHAEQQFVKHQQAGQHDAGVRVLETVLKDNQQFVATLQDTLLSSLFEKLAVGYNTLGMKYLKQGKTDLSLKYFQKSEAVTDPANLHIHQNTRQGVFFAGNGFFLRGIMFGMIFLGGCFVGFCSGNEVETKLGIR